MAAFRLHPTTMSSCLADHSNRQRASLEKQLEAGSLLPTSGARIGIRLVHGLPHEIALTSFYDFTRALVDHGAF